VGSQGWDGSVDIHLMTARMQLWLRMEQARSVVYLIPRIANAASCSARSVRAVRSNICYFGIPKVSRNGGGRLRSIIPPMLNTLYKHLPEKPGCLGPR